MSVAELQPVGDADFGRTPPQDMYAEQCVVGGMLLSKDAIADVVEVLIPGDFYRPAHQVLFDVVVDLYGRGEPADAVTVAAELTKRGEIARVGGADYLHTLMALVPVAANAGYYARIVHERAILRRLVEVGNRITQMGYSADAEVDDVVDRAQAEVYGVTDRRNGEDYQRLGDVLPATLDEIEAIGSRGGAIFGVPTGFSELDQLTNGLHPGQMIIIAARPAMGKALALDTPLPTPDGWTTMGEVEVGQQLIGADGRPTTVLAATDVMHDRPCYRVEFSDGTSIVADAEHQWLTDTRASRHARAARGAPRFYRPVERVDQVQRVASGAVPEPDRTVTSRELTAEVGTVGRQPRRVAGAERTYGWTTLVYSRQAVLHTLAGRVRQPVNAWHAGETGPSVRTTREIAETLRCDTADGRLSHSVANSQPLNLPERDLPIPPYTLGGWLGDGTSASASFTTTCPDCGRSSTGSGMCQACRRGHGSVQAGLRSIGVLGDEHIPARYLRAAESQRRDLLAGLLDSGGTVTANGSVRFSCTSQRLAADVYDLVVGLGYRCDAPTRQVNGRTAVSSTCWTLNFRPTRRGLGVRYIAAVTPIPSVPVRCVQVDNSDALYLAGKAMVPTHNSTLALDLARAAAVKNSLATVVFSLEMSRSEITMRLLSAEAKVALHAMRSGTLSDDDWTRLARRMSEVSEAPLFIDDSPNLTMMEIRAKARRLKQQHDLRMVIVDYMQLMQSPKRVESRQQEVSEISRSMKLLAKEIEVPVIALSQLNRGPEQRNDKKPQLSDLRESGCLTAATRLMRADTGAEVTMGQLLSSGAKDIPVWSLDDRLKLVPRTLTHAFPSGTKEVFRLQLASGREIEATANHPFLTFDGWRPLGEIAQGTSIGSIRHVPPPLETKPWPDDQVVLLAHLLGDGSFVRRQPIRYASVDEANLSAVAAAAKHFDVTAVRDEYPVARVTTMRLPAPYHLTHDRRNPIAAWLDGLGLFGLRSHEKFVPDGIFSLPKAQVGTFLRHLWATDGSVRWDEKKRSGTVYYASTSRRLVDDVARLLLRFNVFSRVKRVRKPGHRVCYHLYVYGAENQLRFLDDVGVHGARGMAACLLADRLRGVHPNTNLDTVPVEVWEQVKAAMVRQQLTHREFAASVGTKFSGSAMWRHAPSRSRLSRVAAVLDDVDLEVLATNDVFWDSVVAIEPLGEQPVYDATVLDTHNFVANGIATHNSLEQDADMVMLLHREDVYERESPRAGEADVIVAKHRNGPTKTVTVAFQGHYSRFVDMAPV